jgi:hypothetical protein
VTAGSASSAVGGNAGAKAPLSGTLASTAKVKGTSSLSRVTRWQTLDLGIRKPLIH